MAHTPPPEAEGGAPPVGGEDKEVDGKTNKKEMGASKFFAGSPTPVSYIVLRRSPFPLLFLYFCTLFFMAPRWAPSFFFVFFFERLRNLLASSPPAPRPHLRPHCSLAHHLHTGG